MSAIRRVDHSAVYSNRRKVSSHYSLGRTLTFSAIVFSCLAGVIIPAFFVSTIFLGNTQERVGKIPPPTVSVPKQPRNIAEVSYAYSKLAVQRTFRANVATIHNSRPPTQSRFEYVGPDRYHAMFDTIEFVILGRMMYVHYNGNWVKTNPDKPLNLCFIDPKALESNYRSAVNARYAGDDTLDGAQMSVFEYQLTCSESNETIRVWIGSALPDGLPHRLESTASNGIKTTVSYYDFNANIAINPPIP